MDIFIKGGNTINSMKNSITNSISNNQMNTSITIGNTTKKLLR